MAPEGPRAAPREPVRRLFFALWPDEAMRDAMVHATCEIVRASGGRPVLPSHLHVTLAFLGAVPERRLVELADIARAVAAAGPAVAGASVSGDPQRAAPEGEDTPGRRLEIAFDHLEHWHTAQLLCALPAQPPAPVVALARRLRDRLAARGFAPDLKLFRPHVTVVRKVSRPGRGEKMHSVVWSFAELALIESRTFPAGALYSVVESFPLCGPINAVNNSETP